MAITISVTRFFYRRCIMVDNKTFVDAVIEAITHILFCSNETQVYTLLEKILSSGVDSTDF